MLDHDQSDGPDFNDIARAMTALSHWRRVLIFTALEASAEELTFEALMDRTRLAASTLSHHLKPMIDAGLVRARRKGAYVLHSLDGAAVSAVASDLAGRIATARRATVRRRPRAVDRRPPPP